MKILQINYSDTGGGAAIAAYRHHQAMIMNGYDSKMLVLKKNSKNQKVCQIRKSKIKEFCTKAQNALFRHLTNFYATWSNNMIGYDISNENLVKESDVIIIHWIGGNTLSIKSIEKILKTGKPVYMFMHDMWAITGGCHHSLKCNRYKFGCHSCPHMHNGKGTSIVKDFSFWQFKSKHKHLSEYDNLKFITPSQWLAERVRESALFSNHDVVVIRNVLDLNTFMALDKEGSRDFLHLPKDKRLLLFGADHIASPYKGWNLLRYALKDFKDDFDVVIYGTCPENIQAQVGVTCHNMGHINDTETLIRLYSACDAFITSSIAENYPNVLVEAMACGLPCIGTNVGGIPEIIKDSINGFVIPELSSKSIKQTIDRLLQLDQKDYTRMRFNARESVQKANSYKSSNWENLLKQV